MCAKHHPSSMLQPLALGSWLRLIVKVQQRGNGLKNHLKKKTLKTYKG